MLKTRDRNLLMLIPLWSKSRRPNLAIFVVGAAHMGDLDGHIFRRVGYPWHLKLLPAPSTGVKKVTEC